MLFPDVKPWHNMTLRLTAEVHSHIKRVTLCAQYLPILTGNLDKPGTHGGECGTTQYCAVLCGTARYCTVKPGKAGYNAGEHGRTR